MCGKKKEVKLGKRNSDQDVSSSACFPISFTSHLIQLDQLSMKKFIANHLKAIRPRATAVDIQLGSYHGSPKRKFPTEDTKFFALKQIAS